MTVLTVAAREGDLEAVQRLLGDARVDVSERDQNGWTPLLHASDNNHVHVAGLLVEEGGVDVLGERTLRGATALMLAVGNGHVEMTAYLLLRGGADIADIDNNRENVWDKLRYRCEHFATSPVDTVNLYSVLRCFGAPPPNPNAFMRSIANTYHTLTSEHIRLFLQVATTRAIEHFTRVVTPPLPPTSRPTQTERAHANVRLPGYRAHRLDLLSRERDGGSDCTRRLPPTLQDLVVAYVVGDAVSLVPYLTEDELLAASIIHEAARAEAFYNEREGGGGGREGVGGGGGGGGSGGGGGGRRVRQRRA